MLLVPDYFFQSLNVVGECLSSCFCSRVTCVWLFTDKLFFDRYVIFCFERFGMAGKITVGGTEQFLQCVEISRFVNDKDRHDPETDPVIEGLVNILNDVFHRLTPVVFKVHDAAVNDMADAKSKRPKFDSVT